MEGATTTQASEFLRIIYYSFHSTAFDFTPPSTRNSNAQVPEGRMTREGCGGLESWLDAKAQGHLEESKPPTHLKYFNCFTVKGILGWWSWPFL